MRPRHLPLHALSRQSGGCMGEAPNATMTSMRRYAFLILFVVVLVTPFSLRAIYGTNSINLGASKDALPLVIVTPHVEGIRREFAEAFSAWHEKNFGKRVVVDYRSIGGTSELVKFFQASKQSVFATQGTYKIDLVWGGGDTLFDSDLKRRIDCLEPIKLPDPLLHTAFPKPDLNGAPLYDAKDGTWWGTALSSFGICYNRDVCRHLGTSDPKTWQDLAEPRYAGWIILADPTRSASAKQAYAIILDRAIVDAAERGASADEGFARGMGLVRQIAANARMFTDAGSSVPGIIA